ncbi:MAG: gliding motility lipoprotein GldD [Salinivirgaceae bacterium]|nr:gliding motility lipoprotein GldD [Salinivirgaceae bacterium]
MFKLPAIFIGTILLFSACQREYTPKPRGYFRIDLPEKQYHKTPSKLPYSFDYPTYCYLLNNRKAEQELYWIDVVYPKFKATVFLSYKIIDKNSEEYFEDTYQFVYKHTIKADAIDETPVYHPEKKVYGVIYDIKGDAASNVQFYLTDSTKNFLRGALYFDVAPNKDSLAPVLKFIRADIDRLTETFEWK